jgi:hypothetical protein
MNTSAPSPNPDEQNLRGLGFRDGRRRIRRRYFKTSAAVVKNKAAAHDVSWGEVQRVIVIAKTLNLAAMRTKTRPHLSLLAALLLTPLAVCAQIKVTEQSNGLAPELPGLNLKDELFRLEAGLPDLEKPYISVAPDDKKDGLIVGQLGVDGGDLAAIEVFANDLAAAPKDEKAGHLDTPS